MSIWGWEWSRGRERREGGEGRRGRRGEERREGGEGRGGREGRGGELVCAEGGGEKREQSIHVIFAISQATLGPTECQFCTRHAITVITVHLQPQTTV